MTTTIEVGNNKNAGTSFKKIQLDSTSANTDNEIQAELATYESNYGIVASGSIALTDDLEVLCKKRNNGQWRIIRV